MEIAPPPGVGRFSFEPWSADCGTCGGILHDGRLQLRADWLLLCLIEWLLLIALRCGWDAVARLPWAAAVCDGAAPLNFASGKCYCAVARSPR